MSRVSPDDEFESAVKSPPEALVKRILLNGCAAEYGTSHGQMMLRGELTKDQYTAIKWFDGLYERYLAALGLPRGIITSTGERRDRGHAPDPNSEAGLEMSKKEREAVANYNGARIAALRVGASHFSNFFATVIEGVSPSSAERKSISLVASALDGYRIRNWKSRRTRRW